MIRPNDIDNACAEDGRMKKGSPQGIWEISDTGRKWLKQQPPTGH